MDMAHWAKVLFSAAVVGGVGALAVALLMILWEKNRPFSEDPTDDQDEAFNRCFERMTVCAWVVCGIMYVILTHWWRGCFSFRHCRIPLL